MVPVSNGESSSTASSPADTRALPIGCQDFFAVHRAPAVIPRALRLSTSSCTGTSTDHIVSTDHSVWRGPHRFTIRSDIPGGPVWRLARPGVAAGGAGRVAWRGRACCLAGHRDPPKLKYRADVRRSSSLVWLLIVIT